MPEIGSIDTATVAPATAKKGKRKYKMSAEKRAELSAKVKQKWAERKGGQLVSTSAVGYTSDVPAVIAPPPTPPAVLMLQEDVVTLIRSRSAYRDELLKAQAVLQSAQANFQTAQARLQAIEQEVQYLHSQIGQLQGGRELINYAPPAPVYPGGALVGIGSVPSQPNLAQFPAPPADGVNRAHASRELAMV